MRFDWSVSQTLGEGLCPVVWWYIAASDLVQMYFVVLYDGYSAHRTGISECFVADIGNAVDFHEIKYIIQLKERSNKENHKENYNQNILGTSDR